jgi:hypothetical protein
VPAGDAGGACDQRHRRPARLPFPGRHALSGGGSKPDAGLLVGGCGRLRGRVQLSRVEGSPRVGPRLQKPLTTSTTVQRDIEFVTQQPNEKYRLPGALRTQAPP